MGKQEDRRINGSKNNYTLLLKLLIISINNCLRLFRHFYPIDKSVLKWDVF